MSNIDRDETVRQIVVVTFVGAQFYAIFTKENRKRAMDNHQN